MNSQMKKRTQIVTPKTTYVTSLGLVENKIYTLTVKHKINKHLISTPILYYRINDYETALSLFNMITKIIATNEKSLCIDNMKHWLFNVHPIRFLMQTRN